MRITKRALLTLLLFAVGAVRGSATEGGELYHGFETVGTLHTNLDVRELPTKDEVVAELEALPESEVERSLLAKDRRETFWRLLSVPDGLSVAHAARILAEVDDVLAVVPNKIHRTQGIGANAVNIRPLDQEIGGADGKEQSRGGQVSSTETGVGPGGAITVLSPCTVRVGQETCRVFVGWSVRDAEKALVQIDGEDWLVGVEPLAGDSTMLTAGEHVFDLYAYNNGARGNLAASVTVFIDAEISGSINVESCTISEGEELCELHIEWSATGVDGVQVWITNSINDTLWVCSSPRGQESISVPPGVYRFLMYEGCDYESPNDLPDRDLLDSAATRVASDGDFNADEDLSGAEPNDPGYSYQRPVMKTSGMELFWRGYGFGPGEGVKIGVADSGFIREELRCEGGALLAMPHPDVDLSRVFMLYDAVGVDNNPGPECDDPVIGYHGTFVTAIMAARTNNGIGGAGISPGADYYICRVTNANGSGSTFSVATCITKFQEAGIDVVNLSVGSTFNDYFLGLTIMNATANGMTIVAASGNNGGANILYPAALEEVISAGCLDFDKVKSSYSSFGDKLDIVGICGDLDRSEFRNHGVVVQGFHKNQTQYGFFVLNGTSFSAPQVTGALAVLLGLGFDAGEAVELLLWNAEDVISPGRDNESGLGLWRIDRALGIVVAEGGGDANAEDAAYSLPREPKDTR